MNTLVLGRKKSFMQVNSNCIDAIVRLHKRGFVNDFQLFGNDLLWVQESLVIRVGEFAIVTCEKIEDVIVCGTIALHHNIKGILLYRSKRILDVSPILNKKIKELNFYEGRR